MIINSFLNNNLAGENNGGALVIINIGSKVINCSFVKNVGYLGGGLTSIASVQSAINVSVQNSTFKMNRAYKGGAIGGQGLLFKLSNI